MNVIREKPQGTQIIRLDYIWVHSSNHLWSITLFLWDWVWGWEMIAVGREGVFTFRRGHKTVLWSKLTTHLCWFSYWTSQPSFLQPVIFLCKLHTICSYPAAFGGSLCCCYGGLSPLASQLWSNMIPPPWSQRWCCDWHRPLGCAWEPVSREWTRHF